MASYESRVLYALSDATEIAGAFGSLPRSAAYLAHSEGMFQGMLLHGERLFPGLCWVAVYDAARAIALFPLVAVNERLGPLSVRAFYSPNRFDVLYLDAQVDPQADFAAVVNTVLRTPGLQGHRCDVLRLRDLRSGSPIRSGFELIGIQPSRTDGGASYLQTDQSPHMSEEAGSTRNLRSQIKRAERRLGAIGEIAMRVSSEGIDDALDRFLQIENNGYKAQLNSLMREEADRLVLSTALLSSSRKGQALVVELMAGSDLAASQICLQVDSTVFVLKVAFNEAMRDASPGVLLMARFLDHCRADPSVSRADFCVRQAWHERWHPMIDDARHYTIPNTGTIVGVGLRLKRALQ